MGLIGDFSNQAIYLNNPEEIFTLLSDKTYFTKFPPLKINCRNTKKIASQNTLLTGVDIPKFTLNGFEGNTVTCKFPSFNLQTKVIEEILLDLINKSIPYNKITLLSPKRFENSIICDSDIINNLINQGVEVSTIQAYKGLENTIIILFDFEEIISESAQRLLYIGISRPRLELYIVLNKSQEENFNKLIVNNYSKLN